MKNVYTVFDFSTPKGRIGLASLGSGGNSSQDVSSNGSGNAAGGRGAMLSSMLQALTVVAVVVVTFA